MIPTHLVRKKPPKLPSLVGSLKFKVCQCPSCGGVQISESEDKLKCVYCNRSRVFRSKGLWNVKVFFMTDSPVEASRVCIKLKQKKTSTVYGL